jgi:hypothetical protein
VAEIPAQLTFNRVGIPPDVLEYGWGVDIDADKNGETELRAQVTHFRQASAEVMTGDILSVTGEALWTVFGAGSTMSGTIIAALNGNTFRLEVDVAEDPKLAAVTSRAQSTWTTFHKYGPGLTEQCEDSLK